MKVLELLRVFVKLVLERLPQLLGVNLVLVLLLLRLELSDIALKPGHVVVPIRVL